MAERDGIAELNELIRRESQFIGRIRQEVGKRVIGQDAMLERLLIGLLCGGHCLVEGVPGLAKTLCVKTLAQTISASFQRIQFTPDLLPADIIGTSIYNMQTGQFTKKRGPIFANLVLADEINRAPAKVQSALLEAMQEQQVTIGNETDMLPDPFLVMATQNPIEQEGTYALPEAQLDRFMLMIRVGYPSPSEERAIMDLMIGETKEPLEVVASSADLLSARQLIQNIYIDDSIRDYIINLVQATRAQDGTRLSVSALLEYGASPRASIYLAMAARAHAFLNHRGYVTPEDIKAIGPDVLRHRIVLSYEAEAEEIDAEEVIRQLFEETQVP